MILKLEHSRLRLRITKTIKEKDARKFLRRIKRVPWILPTSRNKKLVQEIYNQFIHHPNVCLDTQWAIYKTLHRKFVRNIEKPEDLPMNPF